jgi:nucleoside-diphosphate-sugar epimerase
MTQNPYLLNESSVRLILNQEIGKERFVVTGASGWLGRTFVALARRAGHDLLLLGSRTRSVLVDSQVYTVQKLNYQDVEQFKPTVLIDFAFLTHEYLETMREREYRKVNEELIGQALDIFSLPSVKYGMFTSSGAAVYPKDALLGDYSDNPYGYLKRKTEKLVLEASERLGKKVVLIRPWSLSGTMVTKDYEFAFSSFIRQSFGSAIHVKSPNPVLRRYVAAEDLLALALVKLFSGSNSSEVLESGGDLILLSELAQKVADLQTHEVSVVSEVNSSEIRDPYHSDNIQWVQECKALGFVPESLIEQILRNINFYRVENEAGL